MEDKLRRRLREQFSQTQAELETLGRIQQELTQGKNKLDDILSRLDKEQVILSKIKIIHTDHVERKVPKYEYHKIWERKVKTLARN